MAHAPGRCAGAAFAVCAAAVLLCGCGVEGSRATATPSRTPSPAVTAAPTSPATEPSTNPPPAVQPLAGPGTATAALATLAVKGRAPKTGYSRDLFGQAWADVDHNGCDTRNDILSRDLTATTYQPGTRNCVVLTGSLNDPYSATTIPFNRGPQSADIQIDHVVALSDAWQTGAQQLDMVRRTAFANDPLNLLAVDGGLNTQKSDSDAASWLPPSKSYRCAYVARQVAVKSAYALWVTPPEHDAVAAVLQSCPGELLPVTTAQPAIVVPAPTRTAAPTTQTPAPTGTPFANCAAARAAGAAPVHRGDPGYSAKLDGDGDGVGCE